MTTHFHQTWTTGRTAEVNTSRPFYWCVVPPKSAWSTGGLHFTFISQELPIQRMGWAEIKGYYIDNVVALNQSLDSTPQEIWDDWVPKVDAVNFDHGASGFGDDERFQSVEEITTGGEGQDPGEDNVQDEQLLSHPMVFQQVDWLGLGPTCIYEQQVPLGVGSGRGMPVTDQTQRYIWETTIQKGMVGGSGGKIGVVIFGVSIPELGAAERGTTDNMTERLSPWTHWTQMVLTFLKAEREFTEAMLSTDQDDLADEFKELIAWKRTYGVGDDTWQNTDGKFFVRGSATISTMLNEERRHI